MVSDKAFPANKTDYFENFTIKWSYSTSATGPWLTLGETKNPLYVTYNKPIEPKIFHTIIHLACLNGKNSATQTPEDIVDKMFLEFADLCVKKIGSNNCIQYWGEACSPTQDGRDACYSTEGILTSECCRCGGISDMFQDMIETQGITGSAKSIVRAAPCEYSFSTEDGCSGYMPLTVQDEFFNSATQIPPPQINEFYQYLGGQNHVSYLFYVKNWATFFITNNSYMTDRNNLMGLPAQGTQQAPIPYDPQPHFSDHAIVKYNNKYYDPSYGSISNSKQEWENKSIDGIGGLFILSNIYFITPIANYYWLRLKNDLSTDELIINP